MQAKFPEHIWIVAAVGVVMDGCSCFLIPWCSNYFLLMLPICILCFGIAMVDTALLPTLGYIVDKVGDPFSCQPPSRSANERARFPRNMSASTARSTP